jgi:release factor glutamine methyltransferase
MASGALAALLSGGQDRLQAAGIEGARLDAEVLLAHALGVERGRLALLLAAAGHGPSPLNPGARSRFESLIERRARREPVAYLTGRREFWSLDFEVNPAVLVPRPETELVVSVALDHLEPGRPARVLDVGTGSGAIAVALAVERPRAWVVATDSSEQSLVLARRNARRHGVGSRIVFAAFDLAEALSGGSGEPGFDLIVSNPPYIADSERDEVMPDVLAFEPHQALFSGPTGMEIIERLVPEARRLLRPGGRLVMEVASARADRTASLLRAAGGWRDIAVHDDLAQMPRVVEARREPAPAPRSVDEEADREEHDEAPVPETPAASRQESA